MLLNDIYLLKTDSAGAMQWSKKYGGADNEGGFSTVYPLNDTGFIVMGFTNSFPNGSGYMIKTDASGNSGCNEGNPQTIVNPVLLHTSQYFYQDTSITFTPVAQALSADSGSTVTTICSTWLPDLQENNNLFNLSPNPATDHVDIFYRALEASKIEIFNLVGEKFFKSKLIDPESGNYTIDVNGLPSGIYFIIMQTEKGREVQKLIKQ
jgi:hypothetical protein